MRATIAVIAFLVPIGALPLAAMLLVPSYHVLSFDLREIAFNVSGLAGWIAGWALGSFVANYRATA